MELWPHRYIRASAGARAKLRALRPEQVASVAVIKHAALGDQVHTRPFLRTLRRHFANARITFSTNEGSLAGAPEDLVDRMHVAMGQFRPRGPFHKRLRTFRELGYHDLIFDLTASTPSAWITLVNPARVKLGFRHNPLASWIYDVTLPRAFMKLEAESFLDQLAILRIPYDWPLDYGYPPHEPRTDPPYVLYFPTASHVEKSWPAERFSGLLGALARALPAHEHRLMFGVQPWEQAAGERILQGAPGADNVKAVRDARGEEFQAMVRGATLMIANDTGVRNVAIARGVPTLGIFGISLPDTYLPRFGHHTAVFASDGGWPDVPQVAEAALRLMERIGGPPPG